MTDVVLNLGEDANVEKAFVSKAEDPVILPSYAKPGDFYAQYPIPLDPTEVLATCEEVTLYRALPEVRTALNAETWREIAQLGMISGSTYAPSYIAFADGYCPEEFAQTGSNFTVYHKNIGAKKNLSYRDIMHSMAVAITNWHGINQIVGGFPSGEGVPGGSDMPTFQREVVLGVKEKSVRLAVTLVLNGWDRLLVKGNSASNPYEFDGIENYDTNMGVSFHSYSTTGTFSAAEFDRVLAEGCAKPTHVLGHPQAIQEMLSGYFQLGFAGSQVVNFSEGGQIVPGFNFAGFVNTGVGRLAVIADNNFTRTNAGGGFFLSNLYAMRFTHDGEPLVYKSVQVPLSYVDLNPGCTAISFQVWAATALIIKAACAQTKAQFKFTGRITTTCNTIG